MLGDRALDSAIGHEFGPPILELCEKPLAGRLLRQLLNRQMPFKAQTLYKTRDIRFSRANAYAPRKAGYNRRAEHTSQSNDCRECFRGADLPMSDGITPFRIAITDDELEDLKRRLRATRWPERECVDDWTQGLPLAYAQEVASYWLEKYDWRAREALLNRFPQFKTEIDGLGIHFIHVRSPHPDATPLLVTHGWPGSIVEFQKIIEPLTNPTAHGGEAADAFHLVCPSLPGYGFSDKPTRTGWNVQRIARAWSELMLRLGYKRYAAQGGDWGAAITTCIGFQDPANCLGIHVNLPARTALAEVRIDPSSSDLTVT